MSLPPRVDIVEVGPRDGFQPVDPFIPTAEKIAFLRHLHAAGIRRVEATAFVSDTAVPQLADAVAVLEAAQDLADMDAQVLVPNQRHADRALAAGARHLAFVVSVSEKHNRNNVRRTPTESAAEFGRIAAMLPSDVAMRLNLATAFDCPFDGPVPIERSLALMDALVPMLPTAEFCFCDTTGRVTPDRVAALLAVARARYAEVESWAYHGHDTYGLGVANVLAALGAGASVIDASAGGLGGCPFAPGATGNVATEDVVWTLDRMGVDTGIDLDRLVAAAHVSAALPGAMPGGRVRDALSASLNRGAA